MTHYQFRGVVTFVLEGGVTEYMHLFTADGYEGEQIVCNEGELVWVEKSKIVDLNIWEGDKIFLRLLDERESFFSLKLVYSQEGILRKAVLDGKEIEA